MTARAPIRGGLPALLAALVIVGLIRLLVGCQPYEAAWRTTYAVREVGTLADRTIADVHKAKRLECIAAGKLPGTPELDVCLGDKGKALQAWRTYARPALDSALSATVAAIQIAEKAKAKNLDWIGLLRPGLCAVARCLEAWGHLLPPATLAALRVPLAAVQLATCPEAP